MRNEMEITKLSFGDTGTGTVGRADDVYGRCCCFLSDKFWLKFALCLFNSLFWATPSVCWKTLKRFSGRNPKTWAYLNEGDLIRVNEVRRVRIQFIYIYYCLFLAVLIKWEWGRGSKGQWKSEEGKRNSGMVEGTSWLKY